MKNLRRILAQEGLAKSARGPMVSLDKFMGTAAAEAQKKFESAGGSDHRLVSVEWEADIVLRATLKAHGQQFQYVVVLDPETGRPRKTTRVASE